MKKYVIGCVAFLYFGVISATSLKAEISISQSLNEKGIAETLEIAKEDPNLDPLTKGFLFTFDAIEKSLQTRWKHQLSNSFLQFAFFLGSYGSNIPTGEPSKPDLVSKIFKVFLEDIEPAKLQLETAITKSDSYFELRIGDLWFDLNGNKLRDKSEGAESLLAPIFLSPRQLRLARENEKKSDFSDITIRFDQSDAAWLLAYTELLSATSEVFLAFDPTPVFERLKASEEILKNAPTHPPLYSEIEAKKRIEDLNKEMKSFENEMAKLNFESENLMRKRDEIIKSQNAQDGSIEIKKDKRLKEAELEALKDEITSIQKRNWELRGKLQSIGAVISHIYENSDLEPSQKEFLYRRSQMEIANAYIDPIYVIIESFKQKPDAKRLQTAHANLQNMIHHNKAFWELVEQETDNANEWIPNQSQTAALGIEIPENASDIWLKVLSDAEQVLNGNLLIPHPFLPAKHGINLKAYIENPVPLDFAGVIQGSILYPYVEKGPKISNENWQIFNNLVNGRAGTFALYFN